MRALHSVWRAWPQLMPSTIDNLVLNLNVNTLNAIQCHAPLRRVSTRRPPAPWITREVKQLMRIRNRLHKLFLRTRSVLVYNNFKNKRNQVQPLLRAARSRYYMSVFDKLHSPAQFWRELRRLDQLRSNTRSAVSIDLNALNSNFVAAATVLPPDPGSILTAPSASSLFPNLNLVSSNNYFFFYYVYPADVLKAIASFLCA